MSSPKRLYRSSQDRVLAGICGGIAEYYNVDPVWVRLIAVLVALATGVGILVYLLAWILIPENPDQIKKTEKKVVAPKIKKSKPSGNGSVLVGTIILLFGVGFLLKNLVPGFSINFIWPIAIVVIGIFLLRGNRK